MRVLIVASLIAAGVGLALYGNHLKSDYPVPEPLARRGEWLLISGTAIGLLGLWLWLA